MRYVQRLNPKRVDEKGKKIEVYIPALEEYVGDMATIIDHIFSYEFNTQNMESVNPETKTENPYERLQGLSVEEVKKFKMYTAPLRRD